MPERTPTCPICGAPLEPGDHLLAYLYRPKGWWVVHHLRKKKGPEITHPLLMNEDQIQVPNATIVCARAMYDEPKLK